MALETTLPQEPKSAHGEPAVKTLAPQAWPGFDDLVAENDEPVDSVFQERLQRLPTQPWYSSRERRPFAPLAGTRCRGGVHRVSLHRAQQRAHGHFAGRGLLKSVLASLTEHGAQFGVEHDSGKGEPS